MCDGRSSLSTLWDLESTLKYTSGYVYECISRGGEKYCIGKTHTLQAGDSESKIREAKRDIRLTSLHPDWIHSPDATILPCWAVPTNCNQNRPPHTHTSIKLLLVRYLVSIWRKFTNAEYIQVAGNNNWREKIFKHLKRNILTSPKRRQKIRLVL